MKEIAKEYIGYGLQVIPLRDKGANKKRPYVNTWKDLQGELLTPEEADLLFGKQTIRKHLIIQRENEKTKEKYNEYGIIPYGISDWIGIITGSISGSLEVIDIDTKYDLTGNLWTDFHKLIEDNLPPEITKALVIVRTVSGGYHIYYRSEIIEGNQKLAKRPATEQEITEYGDKAKALIETRGEKGYVVAPPTPGYSLIQGSFDRIPTITFEQREIIFALAKNKSFNTYQEIVLHSSGKAKSDKSTTERKERTVTESLPGLGVKKWEGTGAFEDYNERADVVGLLEKHGWKVVADTTDRVILLRPGKTKTKSSGNYHKKHNTFRVWSESTEFIAEKSYNPAQVYTILEHRGDQSSASKKLYELGYGEKKMKHSTPTVNEEAPKLDRTHIPFDPEPEIEPEPPSDTSTDPTVTEENRSIYVSYVSKTPESKILETLNLWEAKTDKKVYLIDGASKMRAGYEYRLKVIKDKYTRIEDEKGGELTIEDQDRFIEEVVFTANELKDPIDRDRFRKLFIALVAPMLRVTDETFREVTDRLKFKADKDNQTREIKSILSEANDLLGKGATDKALVLIETSLKKARTQDLTASFDKLREIPTEEGIKEYFRNTPDSLRSGLYIKKEELLFPSGALTGIAGATGHGKTDILINCTLNAVTSHPDKQFYFFTYEMSEEAILVRFLNTYLATDLNSTPSNQRVIKDYFKTGSAQYIKNEVKDEFIQKTKEFFRDIVGSGRLRVKGINYLAPELNLAMETLTKKGNVGGFFIDYFQLLKLPKEGYKNYSRQEELKVICVDLNETAKDLRVPIILGAQFNREVTTPFKLHATNIGEAGDIERILDTLIGIWFTDKKINDKLTKAETNDMERMGLNDPGQLYVTVLKSREIASGAWDMLNYNGKLGKIKSHGSNETQDFFTP